MTAFDLLARCHASSLVLMGTAATVMGAEP